VTTEGDERVVSTDTEDADLPAGRTNLTPLRRVEVIAAIIAVPAIYLVFVAQFSINVPYEDDWTVVPLIHAALHGHLTFGSLWALHNENRILVPNLIFVTVGVLTHDDLRILVALAAGLFMAAFFAFLTALRSYLGRPLTPILVLVLGVVWFSLEDWGNALWAFQIAWYVILFCLMVMLRLLLVAKHRTLAFTMALLAAVTASFSFLQGLTLWPVGLVCLLWTRPLDLRTWARRERAEVVVWLGAAVATSVGALWGYKFQTLGCNVGGSLHFSCSGSVSSFALHHPITTLEFVLVEIGEVIPNGQAHALWVNGVLGAALLGVAAYVVVRSLRQRHRRGYLPTTLIIFGLLFDLFVAVARAPFLTALAPQSIYTMPNIIILIAIISYAWPLFDLGRSPRVRLVTAAAIVFLAAQVAVATYSGIHNARTYDHHQNVAARLVVNLDEIPSREQGCYELYGEFVYLIFAPGVVHFRGFGEAKADQLTVFSPRLYSTYRSDGLPRIPQCQIHP
jgi:hypothetical protein